MQKKWAEAGRPQVFLFVNEQKGFKTRRKAMATPTNLLELAQQRLTNWTTEKNHAQTAMRTAQTALTDGLAALQTATNDFTTQTNAIAALRTQLEAIVTRADAAPLLRQLETRTIAQRSANATILIQQSVVDNARADLDAARALMQAIDAAMVAMQAAVTAAEATHIKREAAKNTMTQPPLTDVVTRVTDLLASQIFTDAETRINADFPPALKARSLAGAQYAEDKAKRAATTRTDIQALIDANYNSSGNAKDKIAALERALNDADQALYDYASRASSRCDVAEAVLERIGSTDNAALTTEEHDAINDVTLLPVRVTAASAEDARDAAADAADAAQAKYDVEYLKVLATAGAAGVTAALADSTSDLAQTKTDLDNAENNLTEKAQNYDLVRETMDTWRTAVPDSAWRDLFDFQAAENTLNDLKQDPSAVITAASNAEAAVLTGLLAADEEARLLRIYTQTVDTRTGAAHVATALLDRARFSALRGDA